MKNSIKKIWLPSILLIVLFSEICSAQMNQEWARRLNGTYGGVDEGFALCVDDSGNVYVTGGVQIQGGFKCTTIKYSKDGDTLWIRDYQRPGGTYNIGYDMKLDKFGNLFVAGAESLLKYDRTGFLNWTAYDEANYKKLVLDSLGYVYIAGMNIKYVLGKYDRFGNRIWINRDTGGYTLQDLDIDKLGNLYITGQVRHSASGSDYRTIKYSNDGHIIWIREYSRPGADEFDIPYALTTDIFCNVYVTGASRDENSIFNCTTVKYDSSGNLIWVKRLSPQSNAYDIKVDSAQNVYLAGRSAGNNYAIKLDSNGNLLWIRTYPTSYPYATNHSVLLLDSVNNVYITANINSPYAPTQVMYGAMKYDNDGNLIYLVTYHYTNIEYNYVNAMALGRNGSLYLTGESNTAYATVKYKPIITEISESNSKPVNYSLAQNYPNPFNPSSNLGFGISKLGFVSLKVYDVLGNEVAVLVNENKPAGSYEVEFNGSNHASGIYFYRLEVNGNHIDTKRMILLK